MPVMDLNVGLKKEYYSPMNDAAGYQKRNTVSPMPSGNDRAAYEKAMADTYANTLVSPGIFGTTLGEKRGYTGNPDLGQARGRQIVAPTGNPTAGNLSMSFGSGRGSSGPSVPSGVLTPQTFAPYESTYVPPTMATPIPYDYATRSPYVYGDGLSNAGAAYNIWGSKPGENPYVMTTPADYTPGLLGLDPVTLPGNMPNKAADISAFTPAKQKTPEQIVRDYGYTGRTAPMQTNVPPSMRDSAPNAQVMLDAAAANVRNGRYNNMQEAMNAQQAFNLKYPTLTPAENKAQIAKSQEIMNKRFTKPVEAKPTTPRTSIKPVAGTGAKGPAGGASFTKIDKLISSKSTKNTGGSSKNYFNNRRITGGR